MNAHAYPIARFKIGRIVKTPQALERLTRADISLALGRHQSGDWGEGDAAANEQALIEKRRLWSVYRAENGTLFWLITEADRSYTTILFPSEY